MLFDYEKSLIRKNSRGKIYLGPLGLFLKDEKFHFYFWSPDAISVEFLIYKHFEDSTPFKIIKMKKTKGVWFCKISKNFESYSYNLKVEHANSTTTFALDPYAFSLAPFDWTKNETPKAFLIDIFSEKAGQMPSDINLFEADPKIDAQIYELHVRDFSSLSKKVQYPGTFIGAIDNGIFSYLNKLNLNFLQLLPLHSCYTFAQKSVPILHQGDGKGHYSAYNWGYDPINFFSLNSSFSTNPQDPYAKIVEFRNFVDQAHKNNIGIILDVVYNHTFENSVFENVAPGHFYRENAEIFPVGFAPLDSQKPMAFRLILDSLIFFVKYYKVDGFRFDLASFLDKKSLKIIDTELRKINPNILLYGEAWDFSDLPFSKRLTKGKEGNNFDFGYFNDTIRNAVRGSDSPNDKGLILSKNAVKFGAYVSSIPGNIADFDFKDFHHSKKRYDLFANEISLNLAYLTCHDGPTLADKILSSSPKIGKKQFIETYRQALMLVSFVQGKVLFSSGSEFCFSKVCDFSGATYQACHPNLNQKNPPFEFLNADFFDFNSYKTTDFTNGLKFDILKIKQIEEQIFNFFAKINEFRQKTKFFRLKTNQQIKDCLNFETVDKNKGLIIYQIDLEGQVVKIIHNFSNNQYEYNFDDFEILFNSKLNNINNLIQPHQSILLTKRINFY
ncbi:alpha-amylase family glycosyl hydrolase [Mesomycoplasma ovipneumoniae]|uniref:alpha-amylase family glycosyl hydrolase n=1 Tax=Mesomycoplasma ovipneumoniae TaxID=29562 RepID=UPI003080A274